MVQDNSEGRKNELHLVTLASSAGGLEALKRFLGAAEPESSVTYVVIQHLDPTHESLFPELLQRATSLEVSEVRENVNLQAGHVYVISPNSYLELEGDRLKLTEPSAPRGMRMAVDHFLRSASKAFGPRMICCILSGSGMDGSQGAKAVKEAGGLVLVQDPDQAGFDGMPQSTIRIGYADRVLPAEEMPELIREFLSNGQIMEIAGEEGETGDLERLLEVVHERTGYDFTAYKTGTVTRRVSRRMRLHNCEQVTDYIDMLRNDDEEVQALRKDLLISVTHFFRDPEVFAALAQQVLPKLCKGLPDDQPLRIWCPGVATGEEAYSLAILAHEAFAEGKLQCRLQLFATDVDRNALETARSGWYPSSIEGDVSPQRLEKWFYAERGGYRVRKSLRETITFAEQNLLQDPPYSSLDLISCRNLLIYLEKEVQEQAAAMFHFALKPEGYLLLGPAEAAINRSGYFKPVDNKLQLYKRMDIPRTLSRRIPATPFERQRQSVKSKPASLDRNNSELLSNAARQAMARHDRICIAVVDAELGLQYVMGEPQPYLALGEGVIDRHLGGLAREGLKAKVRMALHNVVENQQEQSATSARMKIDGTDYRVLITARPVQDNQGLYACVFECREPVAPGPSPEELDAGEAAAQRIGELEQELSTTRDDLNATIEQLETTNEELRASNEEVISVNEELQSTNEELETSKEELQSVNEELTTVNQQLQEKMREVTRSHDDLANLLTSTNIATVFLDDRLRIRRTTAAADDLLNTQPCDKGRQIAHFASVFEGLDLAEAAQAVLDSQQPQEHEIRSRKDYWYSVRLHPYRETEGRVEGIIITLVDIDRIKRSQQALQAERELMNTVLETLPVGLVVTNAEGGILRDNSATRDIWGIPLEGKADTWKDYEDFVAWWPDTGQRIRAEEWAMSRALSTGQTVRDELVQNQKFNSDEKRYYSNNVSPLRDAEGNIIGGVAAMLDVTERIQAEKDAQESQSRFRTLADNMNQFAWIAEADTGDIFWYNRRWFEYTGTTLEQMQGWGWMSVHHPDHIDRVVKRFKQALASGEEWEDLFPLRGKDGQYRWFLSRAVPIRDDQGRVNRWFGTNTDITEQRNAELALQEERQKLEDRVRQRTEDLERSRRQVRRLHHLAATAEQRERRRIAEGLHDDVQQLLAAARMGMAGLSREVDDSALKQRLESVEEWTEQALSATRTLIFDLSPAILYEVGLEQALKHLGHQFQDRFGLDVRIRFDDAIDPLDETRRVFVYSTVRELLFNVAKHADVDIAHVDAARKDGKLEFVVRDNGRGFDPQNIREMDSSTQGPVQTNNAGSGLGLAALKERIRNFEGDMEIDSAPGKGCRIRFWAPIEN